MNCNPSAGILKGFFLPIEPKKAYLNLFKGLYKVGSYSVRSCELCHETFDLHVFTHPPNLPLIRKAKQFRI